MTKVFSYYYSIKESEEDKDDENRSSLPSLKESTAVSSLTYEFNEVVGYSTLCVLQYFCSDYLVYKSKRKKSKKEAVTTRQPNKQPIELASVQSIKQQNKTKQKTAGFAP